MSDTVIRIENLSKMYHLGVINNGTLWEDIQSFFARKLGKEDPHTKIGDDRYDRDKDHFWALKDISFDIKQGDRIGIIGKNGAGKSTLLKILSRITAPTEGTVKLKGKIASLLEVGTGFHGELTGRENIYLNGAVLGMKKRRIDELLDSIIDFSGIEHYINTPVKRYSSGMYVRLAFAVAAHLDCDILIADEVLAVGDAEFQKKALGKMQDLSTGQGKTVLFVSHNLQAVKSLCSHGIILQKGKIEFKGNILDAVNKYSIYNTEKGIVNNYWDFENAPGTEEIKVKSAYIQFDGEKLTVKTAFRIITEFWCLEDTLQIHVSMHLYDNNNSCVFAIASKELAMKKGLHKTVFSIPANFMNDGSFYVSNMFITTSSSGFFHEHANSFEIEEERNASDWHGKWPGVVRPNIFDCEIE
ncbi:MAG: ABC transporter ATP-binding protein [Treponema sp.]|nr:ABC transporter ATP-binding protein [Treponema sp.]